MASPSDNENFHEYSELGESRSEKPKNLEDRLKEKDNEIRDKYGMNLARFVIENCKDGAVTVFMIVEILRELKLI